MARPYDAAPAVPAARRGAWSGLDQSSVMGVELLAGILTWSGLGWLADRWLGTTPWLFGVGAMLGFAAGLYLVWLRSGRMGEADDRAAAERAATATRGRHTGGTGATGPREPARG